MQSSSKLGERFIAAAQVAGLIATGWFVWIHRVLPQLGLQPVSSIAARSFFYVVLAWICGGMVTFGVYFVIALADVGHAARFSLRTSAPAMWFAPAIVLLSAPAPAAFTVSLLLVANATRQLIAQWGVIESPLRPAGLPANTAATAFLSWRSGPALIASVAAQAGLVALLWRDPFRAAACFVLSTAILTSLSIATGAYRPGKPPALPHSALSVVLTFLLAAALTFGGISMHRGYGAGTDAYASNPDGGGQSAAMRSTDSLPPEDDGGLGGDFPGIILLPKMKMHVSLIVPVPAPPSPFGAPVVRPVGIPFSGAYWMFRFPAERPPRRSVIRRGSPAELSFHTTDNWFLEMEAHQKLDEPFNVHCCTQIQMAIRNADPYPGTVALELILIDTSAPLHLAQSLGSVSAGPPSTAEQTMTFPMPHAGDLQKFDEIKVVFRRAPVRGDKSARIAIDRFVLMP